MIDRDKLHTAPPGAKLRASTYAVINAGQDEPAIQILATGLALYGMCDATGVNIRDLLVTVERMKNDLDGPFVGTFDAIREYARNEIGGM